MSGSSPYQSLPARQFWRTGVAEVSLLAPIDLYRKRFSILAQDRISTAGSCFAQHIARNLTKRGYHVIDAEPSPPQLPAGDWQTFGYGLYSARYGNIYTVRQLLQLIQEALGHRQSPDPVWEKNGRYYDSLRPSVEPEGLESIDAVILHRQFHLARVKEMLQQTDVLIFTLGLTEAWVHRDTGWVYPTAPGTIAGDYDSAKYEHVNFSTSEVVADFMEVIRLIRCNTTSESLRFLLTVSPVPLTATYQNEHVLAATTYSKSVLRAAAGELCRNDSSVDYFPSYEIISNPWSRGVFYESNCRSVNNEGVETVMKVFFSEHTVSISEEVARVHSAGGRVDSLEETACEESLLDRFGAA